MPARRIRATSPHSSQIMATDYLPERPPGYMHWPEDAAQILAGTSLAGTLTRRSLAVHWLIDRHTPCTLHLLVPQSFARTATSTFKTDSRSWTRRYSRYAASCKLPNADAVVAHWASSASHRRAQQHQQLFGHAVTYQEFLRWCRIISTQVPQDTQVTTLPCGPSLFRHSNKGVRARSCPLLMLLLLLLLPFSSTMILCAAGARGGRERRCTCDSPSRCQSRRRGMSRSAGHRLASHASDVVSSRGTRRFL